MAPQRIMETPINTTSSSEFKEPLPASLKILEPPACLQRSADYRKKMMIDHEGSIILASIGDSSVHEENAISEPFDTEIDIPQIQKSAEPAITPVSLAFVTNPMDLTGNRKLNLETVAVRLPATIRESGKDLQNQSKEQIAHPNEADDSVTMSLTRSNPMTVSSIDTPISFPLEMPTICNSVVMENSTVDQSHLLTSSHMDVQELVELPATLAVLSDKTASSNNVTVVPKSPGLSGIIPDSGMLQLSESCKQSTPNSFQKNMKKKPANTLTNYFKPVSITLTADEDEVEQMEQARKGVARTIHLSIETNSTTTEISSNTPDKFQPSDTLSDVIPNAMENDNEILEASSMSSVEVSTSAVEIVENDGSLSPVKVVVEKVEDFSLAKTFAALETMTPSFNIENEKVSSQRETGSSSRRKTKSPSRKTPDNLKLPPFKTPNEPLPKSNVKGEISAEKPSKSKPIKKKKVKNERYSKVGRPRGRKSKHNRKMENSVDGENNSSINTSSEESPSLLQASAKRNCKSRKQKSDLSDIAEDLKAIKEGSLTSSQTVSSCDNTFTPFQAHVQTVEIEINQECLEMSELVGIESTPSEGNLNKDSLLAANKSKEVESDITTVLQDSKKQNTSGNIKGFAIINKNEINVNKEKQTTPSPFKTGISDTVNDKGDMNCHMKNNITHSKSSKVDEGIVLDSPQVSRDKKEAVSQTKADKQKEAFDVEKSENMIKPSGIDFSTHRKGIKHSIPKINRIPNKEKTTSRKIGHFFGEDTRSLRHRDSKPKTGIIISSPSKLDVSVKKLPQVVIECNSGTDLMLLHRNSESPKKTEFPDRNKSQGIVQDSSDNILDTGLSRHKNSVSQVESSSSELTENVNIAHVAPESSGNVADPRISLQRKNVSKVDIPNLEPQQNAKCSKQDEMEEENVFKASVSIADPRLLRHGRSDFATSATPEASNRSGRSMKSYSSPLKTFEKNESTFKDKRSEVDNPKEIKQRDFMSKDESITSESQNKIEYIIKDKSTEIHQIPVITDPKILSQKKNVSAKDSENSELERKNESPSKEDIHEVKVRIPKLRILRQRKCVSKKDCEDSESIGKDETVLQDNSAEIHEDTTRSADHRVLRQRKSISKHDSENSESKQKLESLVQDNSAEVSHEDTARIADSKISRQRRSVSKQDSENSESKVDPRILKGKKSGLKNDSGHLGDENESLQNKLSKEFNETTPRTAETRFQRQKRSVSQLDLRNLELQENSESAEELNESAHRTADTKVVKQKKTSKLDFVSLESQEKSEPVQNKPVEFDTPRGNAETRVLRQRKSLSKLNSVNLESKEKSESIQNKSDEVENEVVPGIIDSRILKQKESYEKEELVHTKSSDEASPSVVDPRLTRQRKSVSKCDSIHSKSQEKDESNTLKKEAGTTHDTSTSDTDNKLSKSERSLSKLDTKELLGKDRSIIQNISDDISSNVTDPKLPIQRKLITKLDSTPSLISTAQDKCENKSPELFTEFSGDDIDSELSKCITSKGGSTSSDEPEKDDKLINEKFEIADSSLSRHRKPVSQHNVTISLIANKSESVIIDINKDISSSKQKNSDSISSTSHLRKRTISKADKDLDPMDGFMPRKKRRKFSDIESNLSTNVNTALHNSSHISDKEYTATSISSKEIVTKKDAVNKADIPETLEDIEKEVKALMESSHTSVPVSHACKITHSSDKQSTSEKENKKKSKSEEKDQDGKQLCVSADVRRSRNLSSSIQKSTKKVKDDLQKSEESVVKIIPETQSTPVETKKEEITVKKRKSRGSEININLDNQLAAAAFEMYALCGDSDKLKQNTDEKPKKKPRKNISRLKEDIDNIPDSIDIIESSQESTTSASVVKSPVIHQCSVTITRMNTIFKPGVTIDVSSKDEQIIVLVPDTPGSPYKVFTPEKCQKNDSSVTDNLKISAAKSLTSKFNSVQKNADDQFKKSKLKEQKKEEKLDNKNLSYKENKEVCTENNVCKMKSIKDELLKTKSKRNGYQKCDDVPKSHFPKTNKHHLSDSEEKNKDISKLDTPKANKQLLSDSEEKNKDNSKLDTPKTNKQLLSDSEGKNKGISKLDTPKLGHKLVSDLKGENEEISKSDKLKPKQKLLPDCEESTSKLKEKSSSNSVDEIKECAKSDTAERISKLLLDSKEHTKSDTSNPKQLAGLEEKNVRKSDAITSKLLPENMLESSSEAEESIKQIDNSASLTENSKIKEKKKKKKNCLNEENAVLQGSTSQSCSKKQEMILPSKIPSVTEEPKIQVVDGSKVISITSKQDDNNAVIENKSKVMERQKQSGSKQKTVTNKMDAINQRSKLGNSELNGSDLDVKKPKSKDQLEDVTGNKHSTPLSDEDGTPLSSKVKDVEITSTNSQKYKEAQQIESVNVKDTGMSPVKTKKVSDENSTTVEDNANIKSNNSKVKENVKEKPESVVVTKVISKTESQQGSSKDKIESAITYKPDDKILSPKKSNSKDISVKVRSLQENVSGKDSEISKDAETKELCNPSSKSSQTKLSVVLKENANRMDLQSCESTDYDISNEDVIIEKVVSKIKRLSQTAEHYIPKKVSNVPNIVAKKSQDNNNTPTKLNSNTSNPEKTPSPSPTRPLFSSPNSLLKAFSSPSSGSSKLSQKSRQRRIQGRAQYMVNLAVGTKESSVQKDSSDMTSPISSKVHQDLKSIMAATPNSRKRLLYNLSDDETTPISTELER